MISDRDFENLQKIYVCGGGVNYPEIRDCFKAEFERVVPVEMVSAPDTLAAVGYYHNSLHMQHTSGTKSIGVDLGNSSTYICSNNTID